MTRADNANSADAAIQGSRVIGKVCGGECNSKAYDIPVGERIRAAGRFIRLTLHWLWRTFQRTPE